MNINEMNIDQVLQRLGEIEAAVDAANGEELSALENESKELLARKAQIEADIEKRKSLQTSIANAKDARTLFSGVGEREKNEKERAAKAFAESRRMTLDAEATRTALLTTGNLAVPTTVSGINDLPGSRVSSIIDLMTVENCEGMSGDKVAYLATEGGAAGAQTEGSAADDKTPAYNYVNITPTHVACYSQISVQAQKLTTLNYKAKVENEAFISLRKKIVAMVASALKSSTITKEVTADLDANSKGKIDEKTLRKIVMNYGGDESCGAGVLLLNKTDLLAFGDVRGTNEKKAVYEITPDTANPNTGIIKDGGLAVKYCLMSDLTACSGTSQAASTGADKPTMFFGDPKALKLDLFSQYEIAVSSDFAFTSLMDTIRGHVEAGVGMVVKYGFVAYTIKKATA